MVGRGVGSVVNPQESWDRFSSWSHTHHGRGSGIGEVAARPPRFPLRENVGTGRSGPGGAGVKANDSGERTGNWAAPLGVGRERVTR
jgi:hypothetical protein